MNRKCIITFFILLSSQLASQNLDLAGSEVGVLFEDSYRDLLALLNRNGYSATLKYLPSPRLSLEFKENKIDGIISRVANFNEVSPGAVRVEPAYILVNIYAIVAVNSGIESLEDLKDTSAAVPKGSVVTEMILSEIDVETVWNLHSLRAMFEFVALGRADFTFYDLNFSEKLIHELGLEGSLKILPDSIIKVPYYLWLNSQHKELAEELSILLTAAIESGDFSVHEY